MGLQLVSWGKMVFGGPLPSLHFMAICFQMGNHTDLISLNKEPLISVYV